MPYQSIGLFCLVHQYFVGGLKIACEIVSIDLVVATSYETAAYPSAKFNVSLVKMRKLDHNPRHVNNVLFIFLD